jgi:hypothetical protein
VTKSDLHFDRITLVSMVRVSCGGGARQKQGDQFGSTAITQAGSS